MDEILAKLLESELLNEETKTELTEAFKAQVEEMQKSLREEVEVEVRADLFEKWVKERDQLIDAADQMIEEGISKEINELKEDISSFRDLEVEYAEKIVEEKSKMASQLNEELDSLVDKIDEFLEERIGQELSELSEDLQEAKKNVFGRKIFETFMAEFNEGFVDEGSIQNELKESKKELQAAAKEIQSLKESKAEVEREIALAGVLAPLSGSKREQMSLILEKVETSKLQDAYNLYIGRVLKEEKKPEPKKDKVTESKKPAAKKPTRMIKGDEKAPKVEAVEEVVNESMDRLKQLAGLS